MVQICYGTNFKGWVQVGREPHGVGDMRVRRSLQRRVVAR
jgi:hypothetical protein